MVDDLESLSLRPYHFAITNEDRAVGAHFSGEVLRRIGRSALDLTGGSIANSSAPPGKASAHSLFPAPTSV